MSAFDRAVSLCLCPALACLLLVIGPSGNTTTIEPGSLPVAFDLPRNAITSAGVFTPEGRLVRTLWRGEPLAAGRHQRTWDMRDDAGRRAAEGEYQVRLVHHAIRYVWEGVIGNSSGSFTGPSVHRAFLPPASLVIDRDKAYFAVGYNEQQPGVHGFELAAPQSATQPLAWNDPFAAASMLALDGDRLYWANVGGLSKTTFVGVFDLKRARLGEFSNGRSVCLNMRPIVARCYENQEYQSVIDLQQQAPQAPTGLAVQRNGRILAVAHGGQDVIRLFDKLSGEALGEIEVRLVPGALNQLAMSHSGDLWVISREGVLRYTDLARAPRLVTTIGGLVQPVAVATSPTDDDMLWVADGGISQQLKRFDRNGRASTVVGLQGGYSSEPAVLPEKLCFKTKDGRDQTAMAVAPDEAVWAVDHCNNRVLRFAVDRARSPSNAIGEIKLAYLPVSYISTVDSGNPRRVFANFLEFAVDSGAELAPGTASWRLVRNWLANLPPGLRDEHAFNAFFGGLTAVHTLANGRTYGLVQAQRRQVIVELPAAGGLRIVKSLAASAPHTTAKVFYDNGDLGYALSGDHTQTVMRLRMTGFDSQGDPMWSNQPERIASVPKQHGSPFYRGAFSGMPPRFPITGSGKVVFFDQSVVGNEGFHLGAAALGANDWLWQASPSGALDGKGSFQTKAIDGSLQYGGNAVWAHGRHILYGYHGEFYRDMHNGKVGQANQFMHFDESGLFLGQFGLPSTRSTSPAQAGQSGNAFSPTLVRDGKNLYLYHNDEFTHGGVHRWRIEGWDTVGDLRGSVHAGSATTLR